jgi:hypothetical protein
MAVMWSLTPEEEHKLQVQLWGGDKKIYKNHVRKTVCTDNLEDDGQTTLKWISEI